MQIQGRFLSILEDCIARKLSDVHISVHAPLMGRLDGDLLPLEERPWTEAEVDALTTEVLDPAEREQFATRKSLDVACSVGRSRFRINVFRERGYVAWAVRRLNHEVPSIEDLNIPLGLLDLTEFHEGLVLFTGPTGSGKSTSLAALLNHINQGTHCHILTIEDPIEYLHENKKSLIRQRELGTDVHDFAGALREALREDPDVVLVGEMRDLATMRAAITAAETGHLVFSTLHCADTVGAMDRILAMFPPDEQEAMRRQLGMVLKAVVAQSLLPRVGGGRVAAVEILRGTPAVQNLIRTAQFPQLYTLLETGTSQGMQSFDYSLAKLVSEGLLSHETALAKVRNVRFFEDMLGVDQVPVPAEEVSGGGGFASLLSRRPARTVRVR